MNAFPAGQEALEAAVLDDFIATLPAPLSGILAEQKMAAEFTDRDMTGVGFYAKFKTPRSAKAFDQFTGVLFTETRAVRFASGVEAHFLLGFDGGYLTHLEGMVVDAEQWPTDVSEFKVL